jgi:hypothetical protein
MIGGQSHIQSIGNRLWISILTWTLLAVGLAILNSGCSALPQSMRNLPAKIGLRSQESELRAKVQADKFPSAKEAGL